MKTRLLTLVALSLLSSVPAFAMRESEGPQFSRRWMVAQAANDPESIEKKEWSETSGRALSSDERKKANEEESSDQEMETNKDKEEVRVRRPVFHHVGMGER